MVVVETETKLASIFHFKENLAKWCLDYEISERTLLISLNLFI